MPWWWSSSTLTAMDASCERAPDPLGEEQDERGEDRADDERPRFEHETEPLLQHQEGRGPDEGTEEGPGAAQERHHDDLARGGPVQRLDRHDRESQGVQRPRETGEAGGEDERQVLDAVDVVPTGHRATAVLADGLQHRSEGGVEDAPERHHRQPHQDVGEVVKAERALDGVLPRPQPKGELGDAAQAVVAAGHVGQVEGDEVEHLGEGEGQHREVDPAPAQAEEPDDRAAQRGQQQPRGEPEPERAHVQLRERDAAAVGAEAVVRGVAEGEQPGVAVEQVEAHGEQAEYQHLGGHGAVGHDEREDREEDPEGEHRVRRDAKRAAPEHAHSSRPASPKRPLGRTSSTTAITRNTMMSAALGMKRVVRPTTWPMSSPATTAPSRLPMPPTTMTTNDSMTMVTPISA